MTCRHHLASLGFIAALLLVAIVSPAAADATARYRCEDGAALTASFKTNPGSAELAFADGRSLVLPQAVSADGGRYVAGDTEFWIKGTGASLTRGATATTCKVVD